MFVWRKGKVADEKGVAKRKHGDPERQPLIREVDEEA
jgi:hypothetical protein